MLPWVRERETCHNQQPVGWLAEKIWHGVDIPSVTLTIPVLVKFDSGIHDSTDYLK